MRTKKKTKKRRVILLLVAILLLLIFLFLQCSKQEMKSNAGDEIRTESKTEIETEITEYEQDVDEIVEIDYSKQQEALNALVEEGKMNVNYRSTAVFHGVYSESFNIKNIKNNHYPIIFEIYDENETCIYVSKKIEPGYELNSIKLTKELAKGTHNCKLKVGYAQEGNVSSIFPITIEVK